MKRIILSFTLIAILFVGCKKDNVEPTEVPINGNKTTNSQVVVPLTFTQKLLIEMFSSSHCATCPDAEMKFRNIAAAHPGRVFGVGIHDADAMETPLYSFMDSVFTVPYYASGMLNRTPFGGTLVLPKGNWNANINACLNKTAKCGLKINTKMVGSYANIEVFAGFNASMIGDYRLTVYLFEDSVSGTGSGYNQSNYYNNTPSSPFYQLGNPIIGYNHDFVNRKVLTPNLGEPITAAQIYGRGFVKKSFSVSLNGYDSNNLYVVAFINKVTSSNLTHEIMNVQQTKLGTNQNFD